MHRGKLLFIGIAAILCMLIISCSSSRTSEEQKKLLETVKLYNNELRLAYLEANLNYMSKIATKNHLGELFPTFQEMLNKDSYMRAEQETFKVEGVRLVSKDKGQVDTKEKWVFWWQDHKTNRITKPKKEVYYHMRYDLVFEDGIWKVDKLEDLDLKK